MYDVLRILPWRLALCGCVLAGGAALAADGAADPANADQNVLVTIRLDQSGAAPVSAAKSYQLIAVDGEPVEVLVGSRVPIPVTTFNADVQPVIPITSYTYQNVGFSAKVRVWIRDGGRIKLEADIEDSSVVRQVPRPSQPTVLTAHQRVRAVLDNGVPLRIRRTNGGASDLIEIEATLLD